MPFCTYETEVIQIVINRFDDPKALDKDWWVKKKLLELFQRIPFKLLHGGQICNIIKYRC
jgi:hypothetical protein